MCAQYWKVTNEERLGVVETNVANLDKYVKHDIKDAISSIEALVSKVAVQEDLHHTLMLKLYSGFIIGVLGLLAGLFVIVLFRGWTLI